MKASTLQLLIFLILPATSCQSPEPTKAPPGGKKDTPVTKPQPVPATTSIDTTGIYNDFATFWQKFRTAVLNSDTGQMIKMTEFPLQTRGDSDDDPVIEIGKEKFVPTFNSFLAQWSGLDTAGSSELDGIKKTLSPPSVKDIDKSGQARIGDMLFERTPKGWKLYFVYRN